MKPSKKPKDSQMSDAKKKVSLAWVVRDAAEQYIAKKWPLLRKSAT